ncbi:MAG: hemerythrin domain-containing protein, partial [Bacteroidetes bacterium]|nr:hemerythrin domain-containing protein [Bacteroidota bacterium]
MSRPNVDSGSNDAGHGQSRRIFIEKGISITIAGSIAGMGLLTGCKEKEEDVTPPEDLMREHGILNRVLLVYDHFLTMIAANQAINPRLVADSATIIKTFIEDYHEKQEEDFLFPRFRKANKLTDLVQVLKAQHDGGRAITGQVLQLAKQPQLTTDADKQKLSGLLTSFTKMYRPHEAREDTVLFPALRDIVSKHEFDSLGEDFEKREHQLFGEGGFEMFVDKVANIEKELGIYDLAQFTPRP